jgi:NADPH-dependent 2,4-dienoyl-CoA reductase/sulfur reductase-like enzyme
VTSETDAPPADPLVIVGASLAGLRAAEAARSEGFGGRVVLIGDEPWLPYDRPPLSKAYLESDVADTTFRDRATLTEELGLELKLGTRATGLDTAGRRVLTDDGPVEYGQLIIATGSGAKPIAGMDGRAGVFVLRTRSDAERVRDALDAAERVVVIGGGFIGSEIAAACSRRAAHVTIVEAAEVPLMRAVGPVGSALMDLHRQNGVEVLTASPVAELVGADRVTGVRLADGAHLPADLVVVGIGSAPSTAWLEGSGVALDPRDRGVLCDQSLATNVPGIWAAGDVAHWPNPAFDRVMRLENWTSAAQQGAHAARNALAREPKAYETVPYYWSDWRADRLQFVGIPDADDIQVAAGAIDSGRATVLYGARGRLVGALTLNQPRHIMKLRALIASRATTEAAGELVRSLPAKAAAR